MADGHSNRVGIKAAASNSSFKAWLLSDRVYQLSVAFETPELPSLMEMTLINQLSAGVPTNPTVNHACSQWAAPSSSPRIACPLHTAVGSLLPGTSRAFLRTDGRVGKTQLKFHADIQWSPKHVITQVYLHILLQSRLVSFLDSMLNNNTMI